MSAAPIQQQHVPAWKRLGLTLKHAKDLPPSPSTQSATPSGHAAESETQANANKHTKRSREDAQDAQHTKKRKLGNGTDPSSLAAQQQTATTVHAATPPRSSR